MTPRADDPEALLLRGDLTAGGLSTQKISRLTAGGGLVRIRPAVYAHPDAASLKPATKHLMAVRATAPALRDDRVFSHWSAAVLHGLPTWNLPLGRVAVTIDGPPRGSSSSTRVVSHRGRLPRHHRTRVDGLRVTTVPRTVVDLARSGLGDAAICVADAAVRSGACQVADLYRHLEEPHSRKGLPAARAVLAAVDPGSESVAETRSRLIFRREGLPPARTQVEIRDATGSLLARVDFLWEEHRVIGECDGLGKYFDASDPMESRRRLRAEKDREAALLAEGYRIVRWHWDDLAHPRLLAMRIRQVLEA